MPYIGQLPATGENNAFRILDDISSYVLTFDGSDASVVSASNDTVTITGAENRFLTGQRVTYSKGSGGTVITGLTDDTAYYVIRDSNTTIKLATSSSNATNGIAVNLTGVGGGTAHKITLAFDGTNTKFRTTYDSGKQDPKVTRAAQLVLSINGIIQQPIDSTSPSSGFGIDGGDIVFSTAPDANDDFWGHVLASNTVTFDISDNDIDNFTGDASTVNFTLSKTPSDNRNVLVTLDGVVQYPSDNNTTRAYQVSENELQFISAPALNVSIQVRHIGFAGASSGSGGVTGFYGRTGNVVLKSTDNPVIGNLTANNIVAVDGTFSGNVSIAKTLTYMDVAHIDAVGVVTAQSGIQCLDDLNVGLGTFFVDKSTGFVGIGTIVPGRKLHVVSEEQVVGLLTSTNAENRSFLRMMDPTTTSEGHSPSIGSRGDYLDLRTGAQSPTRLTIDSSGNIGIGTTVPAQVLHLERNSAFQILLKRGGASPSEVAFKNSGNYAVISNNTNGIELRTGSTPSVALHIDQLKRVGIGTVDPKTKLNVYTHPHTNTGGILVQNANYTSNLDKAYLIAGTLNWTGATTDWNTYGFQHKLKTNSSGNPRLTIDGSSGGSNIVEIIAFTNQGKVGIGTVDPSTKLNVNSTTGTRIRSSYTNTTGVRDAGFDIWADDSGNFTARASLVHTGSTGLTTLYAQNKFNIHSDQTTTSLYIARNGRVGIGTDDPDSRLEVVDSSGLGIISRSATTQATDTNRGLKVRNNSTTDTFSVSYRGQGYFAGKVGIGTDNPGGDLHIWDDSPAIRLTDTNPYEGGAYGQISQSGGVLQLMADSGNTSSHGGIFFYCYNDNDSLNAYRVTDNYHSWYTIGDSNSVKMRLIDTGGLGIGTISPHHLLHVHKGGGDAVVTIESTGNDNHAALEFRRTSSGGDNKGAASIFVTGDTSGSEAKLEFGVGHNINHGTDTKMVIMGDGEVGIGTDNPTTNLQVNDASNESTISLYNAGTKKMALSASNSFGSILYSYDGEPIIFSAHSGSSFSEKLRITSTGQVGINQNDWADKDHMFEVVNDTHNVEIARFTSSSGGSGSVLGEGSIGLSVFGSTTYPHVSIGVEENGNASYTGHLTFATRSVGSDSKPTEKMRIKHSGEVGIGTTTPTGTLHLSGTGPILACTADNGSSGLRINTLNQTTGQIVRFQQDGTTKFEVAWNGHTTITNGFSFGPHSGHTNDENVKMHMYSDDDTINDAVNFSVAIQFGNANNGPFMIELYQAHGHYTGNASYCKILGSYGAHDANGGCSFLVLEKQGHIDTGGVFAVTDNSTSTQRTNNTDYTITITGKSASSNTGTSLKVKTYVIVYSRTGPASVVFAEV